MKLTKVWVEIEIDGKTQATEIPIDVFIYHFYKEDAGRWSEEKIKEIKDWRP